jgi:predicted ATPase
MLTRLKVTGFKNLVDVDVRFGPFTCIAGANGVGKSNLFDAIRFLSALADGTFVEAAALIRDEAGKTGDVRSLFHTSGSKRANEMSFEVEMIVPLQGTDDFSQEASATVTELRYALTLGYRSERHNQSEVELLHESLQPISKSERRKDLGFKYADEWIKSITSGKHRQNGIPFLSTEDKNGLRIKLHQDGGSRGKPLSFSATNAPRTILSASNALESPTAVMARQEMRSWRLLQLEPAALRKPDRFADLYQRMGIDGSHIAASLYRMADTSDDPERIYAEIANRLGELIADIKSIWVDEDSKRELYTIMVKGRDGTTHAARALSDGTLRFLALAIVERDPYVQGVLCLEEPENGIHPKRIVPMLRLLRDIAVDTAFPVEETNPLRQVIVNTHSPSVVLQVPQDSLLLASLYEGRERQQYVRFQSLSNTWRNGQRPIAKGDLLAYLNPVQRTSAISEEDRVMDREDLQPYLPGFDR